MPMDFLITHFRRWKNALWHVLLWSVYILLNFGLNRMFITDYSFWDNLLLNLVFIAVFYWLVGILLVINDKKKRLYGIGLLVVTFFLLQQVAYFLVYQSFPRLGVVLFNENLFFDQKEFLQNYYLLFFRDLIYAFLFFMLLRVQKLSKKGEQDSKEKARLQEEADRYRSRFLTAQIYPHFVKNTFQGLVGEANIRGDAKAVETLTLLSELMDYTTQQISAKNATVYVKKELKQFEKLLTLIRLQNKDKEVIDYSKSGSFRGEKIPSITLLTFLENVFKYGVISAAHPLRIEVNYSKEGFLFSCKNRKKMKPISVPSTRIGLDNIRQRLELHLPGQFELIVKEDERYFEVLLKIWNRYET